jgi:phosphoesterase RecJ-like protein
MRLIARLIDTDVKPDAIYKDLYENDSLGRLRLIGRALGRAATELDGRLIYTSITMEDFHEADAVPSDSEDIINMTLGVDGTQAAVIFVEQQSGGFKISLRSRSAMDCAALAEHFGGGGHKKAAGLFVNDTLEVARQKVLEKVRAAMRDL